jgi:nucleoside-diphosphate-sugar epimerase
VVTQFLGQIVRGEDIHLVDGGRQGRAFADISDGISALMRILHNPGGIATGRIYNIGNPANHWSVRKLAETMLALAADYPEYAEAARSCRLVDTPAKEFYGAGYQDVQDRRPKIDATVADLGWRPKVAMETSLKHIFESYRTAVSEARALTEVA